MPAQENYKLLLLSSLALFLALLVPLIPGLISDFKGVERQHVVSGIPFVTEALLEKTTEVTREGIIENTDFGRKLVRFSPGVDSAIKANVIAEAGGEVVDEIDSDTLVVKVSNGSLAGVENKLLESGFVESAETDYAVTLAARADWGVRRIRADVVWEETLADGVVVAIIDTGVDLEHPEFASRYAGGFNFVEGNSYPQDDHGHGTAVAGIALAARNGVGTIGVGPASSLLAVKVLNSQGWGYVSDVVKGIDWAVANGARVINMSLGTTYDSSTLKRAVNNAYVQGVVLVAASGNTNGGALTYPAAYDSVIAVGATDSNDKLASFSALGSELVAPGVLITAPWLGGAYVTVSGTSASAPHVAGVAAHLIASGTTSVRDALRKGTVDLGEEGVDPYFGYGLTDAVLALGVLEQDDEAPLVSFISPINNQKLSGKVVINIEALDNKGVLKVDLIVNGEFVYSSATHPYQWLWGLEKSPPGFYELTAKAYDEDGNVGEDSIVVEVLPTRITPTPTLSLPVEVPIEATPRDAPAGDFPQKDAPAQSPPPPAIEKIPSQPSSVQSSQERGRVRGAFTQVSRFTLFRLWLGSW